LILLRFIFNCAIRWEILPQGANPTQGVPLFENNNQRQRYLNEAELQRLLLELDRNHNRQVCNAIKLLLLTGARKHEILEARWEYVDFTNRILTVPVSKSGKPRHVSLSDAAIELLQSLPRPEGVDWVFHKTGTNKPRKSIATAWDAIRKEADIPDVRVHDLRHSFASFLVNQGRSLYEVQRLLGHHDPKVTMRYAHLSPGALIEAAKESILESINDHQARLTINGVYAKLPAGDFTVAESWSGDIVGAVEGAADSAHHLNL
jgi:integrase